MSNTTTDQQEASVQLAKICFPIVLCLNLAVFAVQIPLSLLNIGVLFRTSLLHRNLKFVLFVQSVSFCAFALAICAQVLVTAVLGPGQWLSYGALTFFTYYTGFYIFYIGHILFIERMIASIMANKYEHVKNNMFSGCWFFILNFFCIIIAEVQSTKEGNLLICTIVAATLTLGISFLEIIAFSTLSKFNAKLFNNKVKSLYSGHNLTERYQLAENIRTGRQLGPTFLLHFINICAQTFMVIISHYPIIINFFLFNFVLQIYFLIVSISNTLIEYTLISRHPILRLNALQILSKIFKKFSLKMPFVRRIGNNENQKIERIDGEKVHENKRMTEADIHFQMLTKLW